MSFASCARLALKQGLLKFSRSSRHPVLEGQRFTPAWRFAGAALSAVWLVATAGTCLAAIEPEVSARTEQSSVESGVTSAASAGANIGVYLGASASANAGEKTGTYAVEAANESAALEAADWLRRMLDRDPQVRVARANAAIYQERVVQAQSRRWPVLSLAVLQGHSTERDLNQDVQRQTERSDISLRWNLFNGGADWLEISAAELEQQATVLELQRAREEACERWLETALEWQHLSRVIPAARRRLVAVNSLAATVSRQVESGRLAEVDRQLAQASVLEAQISLDQLLADLDATQRKLSQLSGEAFTGIRRMTWLEPAPNADAGPNSNSASSSDWGLHAGIQAAQLRLAAARKRARPEAAAFAPRLDLDLNKRLSDQTRPTLSTEQRQGWQAALRWEMPLGGESQSRLRESLRRAEAAEAEADKVLQLAVAELVAIQPRLKMARQAASLLGRQVADSEAMIRAGEIQFEAGRRSLQQLIALREQRFSLEQRQLEQQLRSEQMTLKQLTLQGRLLLALKLEER